MDYVRSNLPKHRLQAVKGCRNSVALLDGFRSIDIDVADRNRLDQFGDRLKSWAVTFRYVSCAKERDAESPLRG